MSDQQQNTDGSAGDGDAVVGVGLGEGELGVTVAGGGCVSPGPPAQAVRHRRPGMSDHRSGCCHRLSLLIHFPRSSAMGT